MMKLLFDYMIVMNVLTFALYGIDKQKAIRGRWRISERTLLGTALLGGSIGALLGMQMFRHKTRHWKFRICVPLFLLLHVLLLGLLIQMKVVRITPWLAARYPMQGADVSHHQGVIDWEQLSGQDLDFAWIKATEGSSHVDERFAENWQAAGDTGLLVGAYHFFSFDSAPETQAELYIQTVGDLEGRLLPAVDVEYYGDKEVNPPETELVHTSLRSFLEALEHHYQVKPIIYTTYKVYHRYLQHGFDEYPLWIRNVYYEPWLDLDRRWAFWQYTDRAVLSGYQGTEKYIDLNVFRGTQEELQRLVVGEER